jgi:hypothetical protein
VLQERLPSLLPQVQVLPGPLLTQDVLAQVQGRSPGWRQVSAGEQE